jgi:hypothetical protein
VASGLVVISRQLRCPTLFPHHPTGLVARVLLRVDSETIVLLGIRLLGRHQLDGYILLRFFGPLCPILSIRFVFRLLHQGAVWSLAAPSLVETPSTSSVPEEFHRDSGVYYFIFCLVV